MTKRFVPLVIEGGKSGQPRSQPPWPQPMDLKLVEHNANLIDLFLIQFRAQMRALVAANVCDMQGLCDLVHQELEALHQENYPHADA